MKEFKGKVAVVTGAASSIEYALAEKCAQNEMRVVLADVEEEALYKAESEMRAGGAEITAVVTDVSNIEKFYIFTHPEAKEIVKVRLDTIMREGNPIVPPGNRWTHRIVSPLRMPRRMSWSRLFPAGTSTTSATRPRGTSVNLSVSLSSIYPELEINRTKLVVY